MEFILLHRKVVNHLREGFYEVRTATLSQEVLPFAEKVQEIGQLVSGALPSLFGGQMRVVTNSIRIFDVRAQALQRLQSTWKMLPCGGRIYLRK